MPGRKLFSVFTALILVVCLAGCDVAGSYRDTVATSFGYLTWAQNTYKTSCVANPAAPTCSEITRAIGLHNAAVDALDAFCAGPAAAGQQSWVNGGPCSPVKGLQGALVAALAALQPVTNDLKLLATGKSQPKLTTQMLLEKPAIRASLLSVRISTGN